jgi:hypothetical protein
MIDISRDSRRVSPPILRKLDCVIIEVVVPCRIPSRVHRTVELRNDLVLGDRGYREDSGPVRPALSHDHLLTIHLGGTPQSSTRLGAWAPAGTCAPRISSPTVDSTSQSRPVTDAKSAVSPAPQAQQAKPMHVATRYMV